MRKNLEQFSFAEPEVKEKKDIVYVIMIDDNLEDIVPLVQAVLDEKLQDKDVRYATFHHYDEKTEEYILFLSDQPHVFVLLDHQFKPYNGLEIALNLRHKGYKGKIFIVSTMPGEVKSTKEIDGCYGKELKNLEDIAKYIKNNVWYSNLQKAKLKNDSI